MVSEHLLQSNFKGNIVFIEVVVELFGSEDSCNLFELVVVIVAFEEWFFSEDHAGHHNTK